MRTLSTTFVKYFRRNLPLAQFFQRIHSDENDRNASNIKHYLLLICPLTAFGLGYWQIERRKWKIALLEKIEHILPSPPIALPPDANASTDLLEFQPVTVEGVFEHSREVIVGPKVIITDEISAGGYGSAWGSSKTTEGKRKTSNLSNFGAPSSSGYFVITPLELKDRPGKFILVNRGWVPTVLRDPITRTSGQVQGLVKLTGYIRYNEKPPPFTPNPRTYSCAEESQLPQRQYFSREVLRISENLQTLPLFIDANYDSTTVGGPIGGQTKVQIWNKHTEYIFTWFTLGTITLGMWIYWLFV